MKNRGSGFTLVELIIVIAILAILAGVAVPVYSGYVKKAQKAADEQLLAAVNTAAAAAVLETDGSDLADGTKHPDGSLAFYISTMKLQPPYSDSFKKYFAGNEGASFKVYKALKLEGGVFIGILEARQVLVSGYEWQGDIAGATAAYSNSNWKNMGVDGLTGTVDHLTAALAAFIGPTLSRTDVLADAEGFKDELKARFGIDFENADAETLANATVFYVADRLKNADTNALVTAMADDWYDEGGTALDTYLSDKLNISDSENHREYQLVTAALKYAVATSYVNSAFGDKEIDPNTHQTLKDYVANTGLTNYGDVMTVYNKIAAQDDFGTYLETATQTSGKNDLYAFTEILKVLNGNTAGFSDISGSGLFSDPEVQAVINEILSGNP